MTSRIQLARNAMATRFELVLHGEDETALRAAGEEALDEVSRLEDELSYFRPVSQIYRLNQEAAKHPVRVTPWLFRLLQQAQRLSQATDGTFDITVAPLMRCWGFHAGQGQVPGPEALAAARACVGMNLVELNATDSTVRFARRGVELDLGSIGKGYAVERAGEFLREAGVTSALLHGGTSTVLAIGTPPETEGWKIGIEHPASALVEAPNPKLQIPKKLQTPNSIAIVPPIGAWSLELGAFAPLATVTLCDQSLSVSAVWGKSFTAGDRSYGHVIDPRTGQPTQGALLSAIVLPSATESDALSTMLLTLGPSGLETVLSLRPGMRALVASGGEAGRPLHIESRGFDLPQR